MARVAVIGERALVGGWSLAGAVVLGAEDAAQAHRAWLALDDDIAVVVLTPAAAGHLAGELRHDRVLAVVMPI